MADVEAWFVEHRGQLYRYLCRAVGHAETARDLTQDVFLRASRSQAVVPNGAEARAWLFTIARNLALDHHRRQKPETAAPVEPGSRPATQETAAAVKQALDALPDIDRDVFLMRETAGLGYAEIGTIVGLTPDAVRSRIHRARLELRRRLEGEIRSRRGSPAPRSMRNT